MSTTRGRWRRIAVMFAEHASSVLPRARSPWAEAMRRELDHIADDRAALRWAIGCVTASYAAQFAALLRLCGRILSRPILAGGMLLSIALALAHASDPAKAPAPNDCGKSIEAEIIDGDGSRQLLDAPCADRQQPIHFIAKDGVGE